MDAIMASLTMNENLFCKLCECVTDIKWKCLQCDIVMCEKCKLRIHPNIKNAKDHKVMDIKEVAAQHSSKLDFRNIKCAEHLGQVCNRYCLSCDRIVCPLCTSKTHNRHALLEIGEGYEIQVEKLKNKQKKIRSNMEILGQRKVQLIDTVKMENSKYRETKKKIHSQNVVLKNAVDRLTEKLAKDLDQKWEGIHNYSEREEKKISHQKKSLETCHSKLEDIVKSRNVAKFFDDFGKITNNIEDTEPVEPFELKSIPTFLPGEVSENNIGSFHEVTDKIHFRVLKQYDTEIPRVDYISSGADNSVWITCNSPGILHQVKLDENLQTSSSFKMKIFGMAENKSNDLLLITGGETVLKKVDGSTGDVVDTNYDVDPLIPTAIHVMENDTVLIGTRSSGPLFPVTGRRVIIFIEKDGRQKSLLERDKNNQRLFTYTENISSTKNGHICLVDQQHSDGRGRVLIIGHNREILQTYSGHPDLNTKTRPFKPVGIATTPSNKIIVPNLNFHTLHILNSLGHFITYFNTRDVGIQHPYSMAFRNNGQLYIGCTTPIGNSDKAKLYEVEMSE